MAFAVGSLFCDCTLWDRLPERARPKDPRAMHLDVQDLRNFYYRSALGRAAQLALRSRMLDIWPEAKGQTVVGFGFAAPLLRPYLADARRVMTLMPGPQGVMPWPAGMANTSVLTEETLWPIETGHVDRLVLLHGLETSDRHGRGAISRLSVMVVPIRQVSLRRSCASISFCRSATSARFIRCHRRGACSCGPASCSKRSGDGCPL